MNKNNKFRNTKDSSTNGWDVLKTVVDGLFNLMSFSKAAALFLLWFIIRDVYILFKLPKNFDFAAHLLDEKKVLEYIFNNDNIIITILFIVCIVFFIFILMLIIHNNYLRKEIKRIAETRSEAMHGEYKLKNHMTSK